MKAYVEKAVPLKGADTISIMLTVPKSDWPEVSRLVMQDVEVNKFVDSDSLPTDTDTLESIERDMTAALAEVALCGRKLVGLAKSAELVNNMPLFEGAQEDK